MKNKLQICYFILLQSFISTHLFSQDSTLVGTWRLDEKITDTKLPKTITLDIFKDSLILIPNINDSINYTRIIKWDSTTILLQNINLDVITKKYQTRLCSFTLNKNGNKLKTDFESEKNKQQIILEYTFQTECCNNHTPKDCADDPKYLQTLKSKGCSGFHRPK